MDYILTIRAPGAWETNIYWPFRADNDHDMMLLANYVMAQFRVSYWEIHDDTHHRVRQGWK